MPYTVTVTLRRNETGEVRTFDWWTYTDEAAAKLCWSDESPEEAVHHLTRFNWQENNYSCDCNRRLLFHPEEEGLPDEFFDRDCGEGEYDLLGVTVNGKPVELYRTPHTEKEA